MHREPSLGAPTVREGLLRAFITFGGPQATGTGQEAYQDSYFGLTT